MIFQGNIWQTDPREGERDDSLSIMGKKRELIRGNTDRKIA